MTMPMEIQARSARLRDLLTLLFVLMIAMLLLERLSAALIDLFRGGFAEAGWRRLAVQFVAAVPEGCYLLALWWVRQALNAFAHGALYTPTIASTLRRVGLLLAAGALINSFFVPGLQSFLGAGPGYLIAYDVSGLVLGAVGLSLSILAHILEYAHTLQTELDEIF
ncbi:MAG: DUF2975 domain-containing protein [Tahibacter sp.]